MVPVKVCGLTRLEDAQLAWDLGAAALGFVFHPASPRSLSPRAAARLRAQLPPAARCVGVFVDLEPDRVNDIAAEVGLAGVQLHGREAPESCARIALPVLKAMKAEDLEDEGRLAAYRVRAFLLDASHPSLPGGTGLLADWTRAVHLARRHPLILAGGLNPGNARRAFETVRPAALDLSSGLEASPGIKDPARLRALFHALEPTGDQPCPF